MSINNRQVSCGTFLNGSSLFTVPPGPGQCLLSVATPSGGTVWVGSGTNVTAANGFPVVAGAVSPVAFSLFAGGPGQTFSALAPAGTAQLAVLISAATGATGTGTLD